MNPAVNDETQLVHYTQRVFRNLLDCMARPGKINPIEPFPLSHETREEFQTPYLLGIACTLLDIEVSYRVLNPKRNPFIADLEFHSNSRAASLAEADYLFMDCHDDPRLLFKAKVGNLDYPDQGATVILSVNDLGEKKDLRDSNQVGVSLCGPGILGEKNLFVSGVPDSFFASLAEINREFPLGLDLIMVGRGKIACIPRSVRINLRRNE